MEERLMKMKKKHTNGLSVDERPRENRKFHFQRTELIFFIFLFSLTMNYLITKAIAAADDFVSSNRIEITPNPYFDFDVQRNVTTAVGQSAFLDCRIHHLGDKSISWLRKRDMHILATGNSIYTADQRFLVVGREGNWTLHIKFTQLRDQGTYECQINTEPKMSLAYHLNVVEAKAAISGAPDIHVKAGSSVTLNCSVNQGPHDLGTIYWYKGHHIIEAPLQDISETSRIKINTKWDERNHIYTSRLSITKALLSDSGNYSCRPTSADTTSVNLHVTNEHPAAMQKGYKEMSDFALVTVNVIISGCCSLLMQNRDGFSQHVIFCTLLMTFVFLFNRCV